MPSLFELIAVTLIYFSFLDPGNGLPNLEPDAYVLILNDLPQISAEVEAD